MSDKNEVNNANSSESEEVVKETLDNLSNNKGGEE